jgi:hypothetical protein
LQDRGFFLPIGSLGSPGGQQCFLDVIYNEESNAEKSRDLEVTVNSAMKDTIISCEGLFRAREKKLREFKRKFDSKFQFKVVFFYRYFLDKKYSEWKYLMKIMDVNKHPDFKVDSFNTCLTNNPSWNENYRIDNFVEVFGANSMILIDYNEAVSSAQMDITDLMLTTVFGEKGNLKIPVKPKSQFTSNISPDSDEFTFRQLWSAFERYVRFKYNCRVTHIDMTVDLHSLNLTLYSYAKSIPSACLDNSSFTVQSVIDYDMDVLKKYRDYFINAGSLESIKRSVETILPICTFNIIAFRKEYYSFWREKFEVQYEDLKERSMIACAR